MVISFLHSFNHPCILVESYEENCSISNGDSTDIEPLSTYLFNISVELPFIQVHEPDEINVIKISD